MRRNSHVLTLFFFLCTLTSFSQKKGPINVMDMLKIKQVNNIVFNKDDTKAAFTVTGIEPDGESKTDYKNMNKIFILNTDGTSIRQLTSSNLSSSQPAWNPDGRQLAFVRTVDNKPQIFLIPLDGGEAMQLTHYKYGATNPKWSPDGKLLLFSSATSLTDLLKDSFVNPAHSFPSWPLEKPGFKKNNHYVMSAKPSPDGNLDEIRAYLEKDEADKKAIVVNKLNFQDETGVKGEWNFEEFYLLDIQKGGEPTLISKGFSRFNTVDFTPDGKQLIISGNIDSSQNPDRVLESQILLSDLNGNGIHVLLGKKGILYTSPKISPSGKSLAFQYSAINSVDIPILATMPMNGSLPEISIIPFDRNKSNIVWSKDEKSIYLLAQTNGNVPLYKVNLNSKKIQQLSDSKGGILGFDIAGDKILFSKTEVADPCAMYLTDTLMNAPTKVSNFNDWVSEKELSFPEKKSFTNNKGMNVEYWVMKPINYVPGKKYPLLLEIHGGPAVMWGPGEASMWHEFQYFCSKGYGVVYCNPRGSGGYGLDFLRGNIKDWGTGPTSDVLTSLEKTIHEGWADTSKLLVTGGSYAGYLVAWIIGHDHRFKAACSQRGVYDLATFFGEGNAWRLVPNYFGGYPWEPGVKELLARESPINYVQNITTPYIIFHGENDRRTGFVQGEMLYRSLKVLGKEVEYVRHPGATHEITRSGDNRQRIDQMLRTYEFFERYLHD